MLVTTFGSGQYVATLTAAITQLLVQTTMLAISGIFRKLTLFKRKKKTIYLLE